MCSHLRILIRERSTSNRSEVRKAVECTRFDWDLWEFVREDRCGWAKKYDCDFGMFLLNNN